MSERDALHAAICAHPDDDTPRLVYADWLDEHGEAKPAAFIRASVEESRQTTTDSPACSMYEFLTSNHVLARDLIDWAEVDVELDKLLGAVNATRNLKFQPTIKSEKLPQIKGVKFELPNRGFFNAIRITKPAEFLRHRKTLFRCTPITGLFFERLDQEEAQGLLRSGELDQIREIGFGEDVDAEAIRDIGTHPAALGVRKLILVAGEDGDGQCEAIASGTQWRGVKWLELHNLNTLGSSTPDLIMNELLHCPQFRKIHRLHAWGNELGNVTARAIATAGLTELRVLDLEINNIENAGAMAIAGSRLLPNLRYLDICSNDISGEVVSHLVASTKLANLSVLKLDVMAGYDLDLKPLTKSARGPTLRALQIDGCEVTMDVLRALASCPASHGLWFLSLASCSIEDRDLKALTTGKGFNGLKILNLSHNNLREAGMRILADWPAMASLRWLDLSGNKIGDEGAKALVKSQYLKYLKHLAISGSGTARLRKHYGKLVVP